MTCLEWGISVELMARGRMYVPRCDFQHTGIGPLGLSEIERAEYDHIVVAQSSKTLLGEPFGPVKE